MLKGQPPSVRRWLVFITLLHWLIFIILLLQGSEHARNQRGPPPAGPYAEAPSTGTAPVR